MEKVHHPTALIVFGATGDLTQNKLYPALYKLTKRGLLPRMFYLYGVAHQEMNQTDFLKDIKNDLKRHFGSSYETKVANTLLKKVHYIQADLTDKKAYDKIEATIKSEEIKHKKAIQRLFYLALPPSLFGKVVSNVQTCKLGKDLCTLEKVLSRIIIEKPFGYDYKTAKKLDKKVRSAFDERQIYRIDHYLGKEALNNILAFRFANPLIQEMWTNKHIAEIQINALETVGLEERYKYYDGAGALRDMVQNHLLQFLAYLTMPEPKSLTASELHKSKVHIFKHLKPYDRTLPLITGQYKGYKKENGIARTSNTETYAALKLKIDTPTWKNTPIFIRTGKNLSRKETSATIIFKHKNKLFAENKNDQNRNSIALHIAPNPSIDVNINVQKSAFELAVEPASLHYCRHEHTAGEEIGDYERLLLFVFEGNQLLFTSSQEVLESWKTVDPFIEKASQMKPSAYVVGSDGPTKANTFMKEHGTEWIHSPSTCKLH